MINFHFLKTTFNRNLIDHMRYILMVLLFAMFPFSGISQDLSKLTNLDDDMAETSGLIFFDNRLITHNDSGGMNALYEINIGSGEVNRIVTIQNASNIDWEDICTDDAYIYIGDFGNNNGNRTNLRIYKVLKTDYLNADEVSSEVIEFSYQDQNDFTSSPNDTNFDAETLISFGSDLYVFTKNWVDGRTNIYKVPKNKGTYVVPRIDEFDADGWITGGTYNPLVNKVILTGYSGIRAFAIELRGFSNGLFSNGVIDKYNLNIPLTESFQTEAVTYSDDFNYYISAEKNVLGSAALYSLVSTTLGVEDVNLVQNEIYPNPAVESLNIESKGDLVKVEIYDYLGKKVFEDSSVSKNIDISELSKGVYILKLHSESGTTSRKFIKE
jgi:hypothetical protein